MCAISFPSLAFAYLVRSINSQEFIETPETFVDYCLVENEFPLMN